MRKPKHVTSGAVAEMTGKKAETSGSKPASNTVASRATHGFIPPPTCEQLMAGSNNLRRVYKVEA